MLNIQEIDSYSIMLNIQEIDSYRNDEWNNELYFVALAITKLLIDNKNSFASSLVKESGMH